MAVLLVGEGVSALYGGQARSGSRGAASGSAQPAAVLSGPEQRNAASVFITGAVVQEDGIPAPPGTRIECVCSARMKRSVPVDSRGFFSVQIAGGTRYSTLAADADDEASGTADVSRNRAGRRFGLPTFVDSISPAGPLGCELRATRVGFRSNTVSLGAVKNQGQFDIGAIVLYPVAKVAGTLVSVTSLRAPKQARKAVERGEKSLQKKDLEKAKNELRTAVQAYPRYAAAWFMLGEIYELEGHLQEARGAYEKAVVADEYYVRPYIQLARLAGMQQRWQDVAEISDHALSLDPLDFPEAYYLNSMAYLNLKKLDVAERSARKLLRLDPLHTMPAAYLILADILEQNLDTAGALELLRTYLSLMPNAPSAEQIRVRIKELEGSLPKSR